MAKVNCVAVIPADIFLVPAKMAAQLLPANADGRPDRKAIAGDQIDPWGFLRCPDVLDPVQPPSAAIGHARLIEHGACADHQPFLMQAYSDIAQKTEWRY